MLGKTPTTSSVPAQQTLHANKPKPATTKAILGFSLAIATLLVVGVVQFKIIAKLIESESRVAHTQQVLGEIEGAYSGIQRAESGTRGYIAVDNQEYVELVQDGMARANVHLHSLQSLIADNPIQRQNFARLMELVSAKQKVMERLVFLRRDRGHDIATAELAKGEGLRLMHEIRALSDVMQEHEKGLLALGHSSAQTEISIAWLAISLGTFLALGLVVGTSWLAHREEIKRRQSEEVVRRAALYSRSLIEASLDPLVTISSTGKITDVNQGTELITGVTRQQLIGRNFSSFFTDPESARLGYEQVFSQGCVKDYPLTVHHANGGMTDVLYNASVYKDENGTVLGVFAAARDITERKFAEENLKRLVEELRRSNEELQQFAYVASHDLQEPLRMVASFTQLLAKRYQGKLGREADEYIGFAVDGAVRMQRLVNDLLDFSRVGTRGKEFASVDCEKVARNALVDLRKSLEESGGQVTLDPLPTLDGDGTQISQVFQNLIANALKFRRSEPPWVHISVQELQGEWLFSVRDNGIGIAPEQFHRIFVLFQRLHTRAAYPGTGIGLAITKKIIERHGGRIWVESQPGKGSTFFFTLPGKGIIHAQRPAANAAD